MKKCIELKSKIVFTTFSMSRIVVAHYILDCLSLLHGIVERRRQFVDFHPCNRTIDAIGIVETRRYRMLNFRIELPSQDSHPTFMVFPLEFGG